MAAWWLLMGFLAGQLVHDENPLANASLTTFGDSDDERQDDERQRQLGRSPGASAAGVLAWAGLVQKGNKLAHDLAHDLADNLAHNLMELGAGPERVAEGAS